jgi:hypothetical protein
MPQWPPKAECLGSFGGPEKRSSIKELQGNARAILGSDRGRDLQAQRLKDREDLQCVRCCFGNHPKSMQFLWQSLMLVKPGPAQ